MSAMSNNSWLDESTIRSATAHVCINRQMEARTAAHDAMHYRDGGSLGRSAQEQREAAQYHEEARIRLERLIGVA